MHVNGLIFAFLVPRHLGNGHMAVRYNDDSNYLADHSLYVDRRKNFWSEGCRHSYEDLSAPTIMPPRVQLPSTPSTLLSLIVFVLCLSCDKKEAGRCILVGHLNIFSHWFVVKICMVYLKRTKINKKKRPRLAHFKRVIQHFSRRR